MQPARPWPAAPPRTGSDPAVAVHTDRRTGVRFEVELFPGPAGPLFGARYLPSRGATAGLVICRPFLGEWRANVRREVDLAWRLAAAGFAVQRFHYRGWGNSWGDADGVTIGSMTEDALAAASRLEETAGVRTLAVLGTRLGAFPAAAVSVGYGAPLALWDPVTDARRYFREVLRTASVAAMAQGSDGSVSTDPLRMFGDAKAVEILGHVVPRTLYDSSLERSLLDLAGTVRRPVLVVTAGRSTRAVHERLAADLGELGNDVRVIEDPASCGAGGWWLTNTSAEIGLDADPRRPDETAAWIVEHLR